MTAVLPRPTPAQMGVAVLLVYGLKVPVPRDGQPGFRLTVQSDGAVWVQPVGFDSLASRDRARFRLNRECLALDLKVEPLPIPGKHPGFVVRRRPTKEAPCPQSS